MGAEQSAPEGAPDGAQQQDAESVAATKLQAITRGRKARLDNPLSRADYKGGDGSVTMRITLARPKKNAMAMITRRTRKLGIELDADNCVVALMEPATKSDLRVGDYVLSIDGHELGVKLLVDVLDEFKLGQAASNELRIRRPPPPK